MNIDNGKSIEYVNDIPEFYGRVINIDTLVNKDFYNITKNRFFVKPIGIHFSTTYLEIQHFENKTDLYGFISKILLDSK